jgi:hypothetical protein
MSDNKSTSHTEQSKDLQSQNPDDQSQNPGRVVFSLVPEGEDENMVYFGGQMISIKDFLAGPSSLSGGSQSAKGPLSVATTVPASEDDQTRDSPANTTVPLKVDEQTTLSKQE